MSNELDHYRTAWYMLAKDLLGWNHQETDGWITQNYARQLANPASLLDHESPAYYIAPELIPHDLKSLNTLNENLRLSYQLQGLIDKAGDYFSENHEYDWDAVRKKIDEAIAIASARRVKSP